MSVPRALSDLLSESDEYQMSEPNQLSHTFRESHALRQSDLFFASIGWSSAAFETSAVFTDSMRPLNGSEPLEPTRVFVQSRTLKGAVQTPSETPLESRSHSDPPSETPSLTPEQSIVENEYTMSEIEVTTFSMSLSEVLVSQEVTTLTMSVTLTHTNTDGGDVEFTMHIEGIVVSYTVGISYHPIALPFMSKTQSFVRLADLQRPTTIPVEADNGLIIGVSTGAGVIVAILAGVGVFLIRSTRRESEDSSVDLEEAARRRAITRRNSFEGEITPASFPVDEEPEPTVEIAESKDLDQMGDDDLQDLGAAKADEIWI
jgi:hypothetical protein